MSTNSYVLRQNGRNLSTRESISGEYVFVKTSDSSDTDPSEEYYFWKYFYSLEMDMIPACLNHMPSTKTIWYEWLEGFEQIAEKYSQSYLKKLLSYLNFNAQQNTFARLKNDAQLVALSDKKTKQQVHYYSEIVSKAKCFYGQFIDKELFEQAFEQCVSDFCNRDVLCHGDLGKSNILVKGDAIKIIDYEYAMFSSRELDYGRLLSSIFLAYYNDELSLEIFNKLVIMILSAPVNLAKLARLTGLQLTMRIIHSVKNEDISTSIHNQIITSLNLLTVKDNLVDHRNFMQLFVL